MQTLLLRGFASSSEKVTQKIAYNSIGDPDFL
jgi:hypothetical protein